MPSQMMDPQDLSPSSFFSEDLHFHDESQNGFWKSNSLHNYNGLKTDRTFRVGSVPSSPFENLIPTSCQMTKGFELPNSYLHKDWKVNCSIQKQAIGSERAASHSLPRTLDHNIGTMSIFSTESTSYAMERDKINILGAQHENGLFSSSLSELFSRKLQLSTNNSLYGHSMGATASHYEEEEPLESLEELEAQTIGNLLPDDDDLFAGVTDGLDCVAQPNNRDDGDLDLFSSVGGMDLGEDSSSSGQKNSDMLMGGSIASGAGKHPLGEHPSRTLFVRNINSNVEDSELQTLFEQYGDIRTLYTVCKHRGFVMISYYDIRAALNALKALQNKPLRHRKLDIHFSIPKDYPPEKDINQGTLAVFNLEPSVSNDEIRRIFCVYGEIKEIRETQNKSHHKLIEFYDSRAAETALHALNGSYIAGKPIKLEPSHPAGARQLQPYCPEMERDESGLYLQQNGYPSNLTTAYPGPCTLGGIPSSLENGTMLGAKSPSRAPLTQYLDNTLNHGILLSPNSSLSSLVRLESVGKQLNLSETSHLLSQMNIEFRGKPNGLSCSLPEYRDGLTNGVPSNSPGAMATNINAWPSEVIDKQQFCRVGSNGHSIGLNEGVFGPTGNGSCTPSGRSYAWSTSPRHQPQGVMWPNSPSLVSGVCTARPQQLHAVSDAPSHMLNTMLPINNHHVGSAPSVNPSIWDRRHGYTAESPEASVFHPGSLGSLQVSGNSPHPLEFIPHNIFPRAGGNGMDSPITSKSVGLPSPHQRCLMFPPRGQMIPMMNSFDSPNERTRSRRNESSSNQTDNKKQFELDIDRIVRGDDKRTTLMIKNIPNKYTSKMLLTAIDERHKGTYDFIYLPIDFKNKCNVGYAFINMTDPSFIIPFYHAFNGKKWEKFNSEKVASLAYARIQGKAALIAHFQNSSLMNEDKRCRPILFHTDGPNAGDQVPFPMGVNVRSRPNKSRVSTGEENNHEIHVSSSNGESSSHGESCGAVKDSN